MILYLSSTKPLFIFLSGADVVIFERLKAGQEELKIDTQDHLDVRIVIFFSWIGYIL